MSAVATYEGFDFRKRDNTVRKPKLQDDEESLMEVESKPFAALYDQWHANDDAEIDTARSSYENKTRESVSNVVNNPLFHNNPGFTPSNLNGNENWDWKHYKQNPQLSSNDQGRKNQASTSNAHSRNEIDKPLNGVIQPDLTVVDEYRFKYIENKSKNNFDLLRSSPTLKMPTPPNDTPQHLSKPRNHSSDLPSVVLSDDEGRRNSMIDIDRSQPINADDQDPNKLIYEPTNGFLWNRNDADLPMSRHSSFKTDKSRSPLSNSDNELDELFADDDLRFLEGTFGPI